MPSQIPPTDSTPKQAKAKWMRTASVGLAGVVAGILIVSRRQGPRSG